MASLSIFNSRGQALKMVLLCFVLVWFVLISIAFVSVASLFFNVRFKMAMLVYLMCCVSVLPN